MKYLVMTTELIAQACENLRKQLEGSHVNANSVSISVPTTIKLPKEERPCIMVTTVADAKMKALIKQCPQEVAWHGTVTYEADINTYIIEDIFVFPQDVTAGTATATDDYGLWLMDFEDEIFNKIRFHGHSHVNMGTSPSGVDINYQQTLIENVADFYIFAIYNKKDDYSLWLYDVANNACYDKADIDYDIEIDPIQAWASAHITKHVKARVVTSTVTNIATTSKNKDTAIDKTVSENSWYAKDGRFVTRTYIHGWTWNSEYGGYINPFVGLQVKDKSKKNKTAYEEYQKKQVERLDARRNNLTNIICDGKCEICQAPCQYQNY